MLHPRESIDMWFMTVDMRPGNIWLEFEDDHDLALRFRMLHGQLSSELVAGIAFHVAGGRWWRDFCAIGFPALACSLAAQEVLVGEGLSGLSFEQMTNAATQKEAYFALGIKTGIGRIVWPSDPYVGRTVGSFTEEEPLQLDFVPSTNEDEGLWTNSITTGSPDFLVDRDGITILCSDRAHEAILKARLTGLRFDRVVVTRRMS